MSTRRKEDVRTFTKSTNKDILFGAASIARDALLICMEAVMELIPLLLAFVGGWDGDALCPDPWWRWRWPWPNPGPDPGPRPEWIPTYLPWLRRILAAVGGATVWAVLGWRLAAADGFIAPLLIGGAAGIFIGSAVSLFLAPSTRSVQAS